MATDRWDEDNQPFVDFSGDQRSRRVMGNRAGLTEYEGIDLASGFPKQLIWTTRDGRKIAIPNMSDQHLLNILAFLRRRVHHYKKQIAVKMLMNCTVASMMFDEVREEAIDAMREDALATIRELSAMPDDEFLPKVFPIWKHLYAEAMKRGILVEVDASKLESLT
jgi:hypothetical protein